MKFIYYVIVDYFKLYGKRQIHDIVKWLQKVEKFQETGRF